MAIAVGIVLVVLGAVLIWGVDRTVSGVEASTLGVVLIGLGAIGAAASIVFPARPTPGPQAARPREREPLTRVEVETRRDGEGRPIGRR